MTTTPDHQPSPNPTRSSLYTRPDAKAAFDAVVAAEYHGRGGEVHKYDIIAALLKIAVAHRDELAQYLSPGSTPRKDS